MLARVAMLMLRVLLPSELLDFDAQRSAVDEAIDAERLERVGQVIADFDALDSRRKSAVNPRELVQALREAIG